MWRTSWKTRQAYVPKQETQRNVDTKPGRLNREQTNRAKNKAGGED